MKKNNALAFHASALGLGVWMASSAGAGTLFHWKFDGVSGSNLASDTGIAGSVVLTQFQDSSYTSGSSLKYGAGNPWYNAGGSSADFSNPSTDPGLGLLRTDPGPNSNIDLSGITAFTIEAFVYPRATRQAVIVRKSNDAGAGQYYIDIRGTGKFGFDVVSGVSGGFNVNDLTYTPNTWYHVALVWDGSSLKFYVNGVQAQQLSTATSGGSHSVAFSGPIADSGRSLAVGAITRDNLSNNSNAGQFFDGLIDEVRISDVALATNQFLFYAGTPVLQFGTTSSSGLELASPVGLNVVLSPAATQAVTVAYAVTGGTAGNGADYSLSPGTLTFNPGETNKMISISITNDSLVEPEETIVVSLLGIAPPRPTVSIASSNADVLISWPAAFANCQLEYRSNLVATPSWMALTNSVTVTNGMRQVVVARSGQTGFFRLASPGGGALGGVQLGSRTNHSYSIMDDDAGVIWDNLAWFYSVAPNTRLFVNGANQLEWNPQGGGQFMTRLPEKRFSQVGDKVEFNYLWLTDGAHNCADCFSCGLYCFDNDITCIAGTSDMRVGLFEADGEYVSQDGFSVSSSSIWTGYKGYAFRFGPNMIHDPGIYASPAGSGRWVDCTSEVHKTGAFQKKPTALSNLMYSNDGLYDYIYGFALPVGTFSPFTISIERLSSSSVRCSITLNGQTQTWTDTSSTDQPQKIDVLAVHMRNSRPYSRLVFAKP